MDCLQGVPHWAVWLAGVVVAAGLILRAVDSFLRRRATGNFDHDLVEVPSYANVYVEQVIAEYESRRSATTPSAADTDQRATEIIANYRKLKKTTWGELYRLERLLVQSETTTAHHSRIASLRARHAALIGTGGTPLVTFDTSKSDPGGDLARAYVDSALREVNRLLAVTACRERLRKRRLAAVAFIGLVALSVLIVLTAVLRPMGCRELIWLVVVPLVGALGGLISSQRRVQDIPSVGESLTDMTNLHFYPRSLAVSAMSGAIFAGILCLLFASGLLKGHLFPTVNLGVPPNPHVPMNSQDLGELLIWCFIAGFAERFVPDTLDRLVSKSAKE